MTKQRNKNQVLFLLVILIWTYSIKAQSVGNLISNGSFEERIHCSMPNTIFQIKNWRTIDSLPTTALYYSKCSGINNVPSDGQNYQNPKSGTSFVGLPLFCNPCGMSFDRSYVLNRLSSTLKSGKIYCVKFYVNIRDISTHGIDGFGAYFCDDKIDTITKINIPLTYLTPQIQNQLNNIIIDTLNWVPVTGTFSAIGNEKFVLLGNFKSNAATNTLLINPTYSPSIATDVYIDDVSCIPTDLEAYAGPDKSCVPGDSVFIGRQPDFAVDPYCTWFQLPNVAPIATISGLWVKPIVTTTYVVKQNIYCGTTKFDTVVIYKNGVGLPDVSADKTQLNILIWPNPAFDNFNLAIRESNFKTDYYHIEIINSLGLLIQNEGLKLRNGEATINTEKLKNGLYILRIFRGNIEIDTKHIVISKE